MPINFSKLATLSSSIILVLLVTGCSVPVNRYQVSVDNVQVLKNMDTKFNVAEFTANKHESGIFCRAANNVETPKGETFDKYIKDALVKELKVAGMYSTDSQIVINGHLNETEASSMIGDAAYWSFDITISNSHGDSFTVKHTRNYNASFIGGIACGTNMPRAFSPSVQELITEIINNPKFDELFVKGV